MENRIPMFDLTKLLRKNIASLTPYSTARDEYKGKEAVFLDANENPYNIPVNRYPDPHQLKLKSRIGELKFVPPEKIFLGNGSDEAIDLLIRAFCDPGKDNVVSIKPTYGMYKVCADINHVEYRDVLLTRDFQINVDAMLEVSDQNTKLMFLSSPNNPTSNSLSPDSINRLLNEFEGLIVLDEAYIDFSKAPSFLYRLDQNANLVVLQTFSKAWGMAGIRLGMAFSSTEITGILDRIKYPYNVNILTQRFAMEQIEREIQKNEWVGSIIRQREFLKDQLLTMPIVKEILPSDANFLMVRFDKAS